MTNIVSITSQGQISIPAKMRRQLGLDKTKKALISVHNDKILVEPVHDFIEMGGTLKINLKVSSRQIRQAFEDYLANEAVKKTK
ncbi:hypothetical protein A3I53_02185 [Candidatus Curtissbacteria bacterium RIFCSPLOWO2_02_FULL_40_13b]|uniref:SpoVT-AbrB domain-containing protein n=1 Tax=Candidatus Curtissbacteria bacterium RIFCSPLOWO2_02_FULL_40_13b TaxID=1797733 RepID=A0A1F5HUC0_9BACT|nr:MAG: hypothetical protein A3I53_02185 [Candidatus Curtissbacteria bacterium RIFCSPLOWO2_02_FULL_40_13b]